MQIYFHSRLWSYLPRVPILVEDTVYCESGLCVFIYQADSFLFYVRKLVLH